MSRQNNLRDVSPKVTFGTPTPNEWKQFLRSVQNKPMEAQEANSPQSSEESSFELEESFRALLERKRREMAENLRDLSEPRENPRHETATTTAASLGDDSTFIEADSMSKISDTSFEEMEQMCALLEKANNNDVEGAAGAIVGKMGQDPLAREPSGFGDVTQLEDIDEPSGLWENTILPGIAAALSPVKRLHLLRPSTIIEESTMVGGEMRSSLETNATQDTFESAKQEATEAATGSSAVSGSDVYRTAEEDTFASSIGSYAQTTGMDSKMYSDVSESTQERSYINKAENEEEESGYSQNSTREAGSSDIEESNIIVLDSSTSEAEESVKLEEETEIMTASHMDPVNTSEEEEYHLVQQEERARSDNCNESHNLSGLDEIPDHFNDTFEETDFMMKQGMKLMAMRQQQQIAQEENQLLAHQKQHPSPAKCAAPTYVEPRHVAPSVCAQQQQSGQKLTKSRTNSDSEESTIVRPRNLTPFGRTNVKGQTLSASKLTPLGTTVSKKNTPASAGGSCKQTLFSSAGKYGAKNTQSNTSISGSFKKPISRLPQPSKLTRKFEHIQSPIGAYIKKTPQSLLQTKINCPQHDLIDKLHSEHGRDSVMSGGKSKENHNALANGALNVKGYTSSIPGKGVVSSNRAHVLDERNTLRIPGGEKMQKLLHSSPTLVIRHEGRIRYASGSSGATQKKLQSSTFEDDSLADLSVVSSDVSVRVLKDAKRY
ncbi:uncharacterized protein LOC118457666 [Anopheles albimanus]|uniref:Uncharacterized protein n=1 Tax=Anopheles albimanus TaxID=7167 RepID=A0A182F193_ANOAL|nr:uncharacterized protein LOC118457666 [Anopheles albimanus]